MRVNKIIAVCIIAIMTTVAFTGCKDNENSKVVEKLDKEPYLNIFLDGDPKNLDPSKNSDTYSSQILLEVNEGLTRVEQDAKGKNQVNPAGAEKWEVSENGLVWKFYLRDNKWSDGKAVTASDYEYGIKRSLDPKLDSRSAFFLYPIKGAKAYNNKNANLSSEIIGVKALDDKTLEIKLENPCAYFLKLTYFKLMYPQRKDIVEKFKDKYGMSLDTMVYSGPFRIKQWIPNNRIELVKNEKYWDADSVKLSKAIFKIKNNNSSKLTDLNNKDLDMAVVNNVDLKEKLDKTNKFDKVITPTPYINFDFFNQKNKLFSNSKIRKAFTLAIDREQMCKTVWKGMYMPAYSWVTPSINVGDDNFREKCDFQPLKKLKEDNSNAKKLLIEGLAELGNEQDPSKVTVTYLQPANDSRQKEIAEFFKEMYSKSLGINVKLEYVQWDEFKKRIELGKYEMASASWFSDYDDPISSFELWVGDKALFPTAWANEKYNKLIKDTYSAGWNKNSERIEKFKAAENILLYEDAVISPLSYKTEQVYKHKYVKGIFNSVFDSEVEIKYGYTQGR